MLNNAGMAVQVMIRIYSLAGLVTFLLGICLTGLGDDPAGTRLLRDGRICFEADSRVTFGATYTPTAIRGTVVAAGPTRIGVHSEYVPKNVFLGLQRLAETAWSYDRDRQLVCFSVPSGTTRIQIRSDELKSLEAFEKDIPVIDCTADWQPGKTLGSLPLHWENEKISGRFPWRGLPPGVYSVRTRLGMAVENISTLGLNAGTPVDDVSPAFSLLFDDSCLDIVREVTGDEIPFDRIEVKRETGIASLRTIDRETCLNQPGCIVVEAEYFVEEGGGTIKRSREHENTHGGECLYVWAEAGHWIEWEMNIPRDGRYTISFLAATGENEALRSVRFNGVLLPEMGIVRFTSTGGWGRKNASEWQLFEPVTSSGEPIGVSLKAGSCRLRMANLIGQHCNLDAIVLVPLDG